MSVSDRLTKLEQRPKPQRPHGMTQEALAMHMDCLTPREQAAFIQTMTDDDLSASIDYLQNLEEQHRASN
ncbi:MAG: hypothetical protein D4R98_02570 [Comamonadaceae bacterium]|nr:MAG: hypothetical protein D4R98_02570 [Comamonadaceae bacterium]